MMSALSDRSLVQLQDWANMVLGAALFVSPWVLGFAGETAPAWNAWVCGAVIAALAVVALLSFAEWQEWINAALGLWVAVSPWLLGFAALSAALWTHLILGVLVAALATWRAWSAHRGEMQAA